MLEAAQNMEFERAALIRDKIAVMKGEKVATPQGAGKKGRRKGSKPAGKGNGGNAGPAKSGGRRPPRPSASGM